MMKNLHALLIGAAGAALVALKAFLDSQSIGISNGTVEAGVFVVLLGIATKVIGALIRKVNP